MANFHFGVIETESLKSPIRLAKVPSSIKCTAKKLCRFGRLKRSRAQMLTGSMGNNSEVKEWQSECIATSYFIGKYLPPFSKGHVVTTEELRPVR